MKGIIDFHTHAFPDKLADKAIKILEDEGGIKAQLDGKVSSLLTSMDRFDIEKSIVCSIATKPSQFDYILNWSKEIRSSQIIPFPPVHPREYIVFGTDSPWTDQSKTLSLLLGLELGQDIEISF